MPNKAYDKFLFFRRYLLYQRYRNIPIMFYRKFILFICIQNTHAQKLSNRFACTKYSGIVVADAG